MEQKSISLELKDINRKSREIVFAHAVYNNIDHTGDISKPGMFNKSWKEQKSKIGFYINHDENKSPGHPVDFWEDETKAYTKASIDNSQLGDDTIEMVDNGIISNASFGFNTMRREYKSIMNRRVRELKEVKHLESSLVTYDRMPANSLAGIVSMTKTNDQKNILIELKEKIDQLETFCRETKASDNCILAILTEIDELKAIFDKYEPTYAADKAPTPGHINEYANQIYLLTLKHFV